MPVSLFAVQAIFCRSHLVGKTPADNFFRQLLKVSDSASHAGQHRLLTRSSESHAVLLYTQVPLQPGHIPLSLAGAAQLDLHAAVITLPDSEAPARDGPVHACLGSP